MKLINLMGLLLLATQMVNIRTAKAQPINTNCSEAIAQYASFANSFVNHIRKNADVITDSTVYRDASVWLEQPLAMLSHEAFRNVDKLKKNSKKSICTLNYAIIKNFSSFKVITFDRLPANQFDASKTDQIRSQLKKIKRNILSTSRALAEIQSKKCFEKMKVDGEFMPLADEQAARLYAEYFQNYLENGGKVNESVEHRFQSTQETMIHLKNEIAKLNRTSSGSPTLYQENLQALVEQSFDHHSFLARKSFRACPYFHAPSVKVFIPEGVTVSNLEKNNFIYQNAKLWAAHQAVEYSDTKLAQYPLLALKAFARSQVNLANEFFKRWAQETLGFNAIARSN